MAIGIVRWSSAGRGQTMGKQSGDRQNSTENQRSAVFSRERLERLHRWAFRRSTERSENLIKGVQKL